MSKLYLKPPLKEAVFEIKFKKDLYSSRTKDDAFIKRVKAKFPIHNERKGFSLIVEIKAKGNDKDLKNKEVEFPILELSTKNKNIKGYIYNDRIAIHHYQPYLGWSVFMDHIKFFIDQYSEVYTIKNISRLGLRYFNEIYLEEKDVVNLDEYFELRPTMFFDDIVPEFYVGLLKKYGADKLRVALKDSHMNDNFIYVLDIDYFSDEIGGLYSSEKLFNWLKRGHDRIEVVFNKALSEKLKSTFNMSEDE